MKNIPVPSDEKYRLEFLHSIHSLSSRCQWSAAAFLDPNFKRTTKETYGLRTSKAPPLVKELKDFQDGLYDIAKNIKFKKVRNNFQDKLKRDIITMKIEYLFLLIKPEIIIGQKRIHIEDIFIITSQRIMKKLMKMLLIISKLKTRK